MSFKGNEQIITKTMNPELDGSFLHLIEVDEPLPYGRDSIKCEKIERLSEIYNPQTENIKNDTCFDIYSYFGFISIGHIAPHVINSLKIHKGTITVVLIITFRFYNEKRVKIRKTYLHSIDEMTHYIDNVKYLINQFCMQRMRSNKIGSIQLKITPCKRLKENLYANHHELKVLEYKKGKGFGR